MHDSAVEFEPLTSLSHTFTHFKLEIEPLLLDVPKSVKMLDFAASEEGSVALDDLDSVGLPAPVKKLLLGLTGTLL